MNNQRLQFLLCSLFMIVTALLSSQSIAITTQGKHFVNDDGAKVIFRGYNLQNKVPPFQAVTGPEDLEPLERVGTNLMRFNFIWEAAEPMEGVYDESYFDYYDRVLNWAWEKGFYVIIDFHNNAFSRFAAEGCGSGFPKWAISPDNIPVEPKLQGECVFSEAMLNAMLSAENYTNWRDFMIDAHGVRTRFFELTRRLAIKYEDHPGVIGFDLNEPMVFLPALQYDHDLVNQFFLDWHNDIQSVSSRYITFLADSPFQFIGVNQPPSLAIPETGMVALDAHFYEVGSHTFSVPLLSTEPNISAMAATRDLYNIPVLVGEYGVNLKNGEKQEFQFQMDMVMRHYDRELLPSARWAYTPHWTPESRDGYHDEDFSCFNDNKDIRVSCAPRANVQVLTGELISIDIHHTNETKDFNSLLPFLSYSNVFSDTLIDLSWDHVPSQGATSIFAAKSLIFNDTDVTIDTHGSDLDCQYDVDERYIHCEAVTPGKKRVSISGYQIPERNNCGTTPLLLISVSSLFGFFRRRQK